MLQRQDNTRKGSYITIKTFCLQQTRNSFNFSEFWSNIWSIPRNYNENASWLPKVKEMLSETDKREDIRTSVEQLESPRS